MIAPGLAALRTKLSFCLAATILCILVNSSRAAESDASNERTPATPAKIATDKTVRKDLRAQAIQSLAHTSYYESGNTLLSLLAPGQPQMIQLAAISALGQFKDPEVGSNLLSHWDTFTPPVQSEALSVLLNSSNRALALLEAIDAGKIPSSILTPAQVDFLRKHSDQRVQQLASKALASTPANERQEIVNAFLPALNLQGNHLHGSAIYEQRCTPCHQLGANGSSLGPNLAILKDSTKEKLLISILDPNREVLAEFAASLIETRDDESFIGIVASQTDDTIVLRQPYGKEARIARSDIRKMETRAQSMMPDGLETGLTPQDIADLIQYLQNSRANADSPGSGRLAGH
jgi:putative heme-binding domain-containing protein